MANVLDIRRRIRSVVNTRQITKAMKTVSAAKLRRAQEGALAARPYSQMLTNVLKSLVSRADIYDPATGLPRHPLLAERPENNILLIVVTGDKGLAGAFNTNILKMVSKFIQSKPDQNIDVECIGRKGRDFMRRRYPMAPERASADGAINVLARRDGRLARPARNRSCSPARRSRADRRRICRSSRQGRTQFRGHSQRERDRPLHPRRD